MRPALINPLLFAVLIITIDGWRNQPGPLRSLRERVPRILLISGIMVLWANLHAGFFIGLAALLAWTFSEILDRREWTVAAATTLVATIACAANAYGLGLYTYTFQSVFGNSPDRQFIAEWMSPDFHNPLNWPVLGAVFLAVVFGIRGRDRFHQILLLGTMLAALISARHQPFFALSLILALGPSLSFGQFSSRRVLRATGAALTFALVLTSALFFASFGRSPTSDQATGGLAYIQQNCPTAHIFASQIYFGWLVYERVPVFFDARTNQVYPDDVSRDFFNITRLKGDGEATLIRRHISTVMLGRSEDKDLIDALATRGWSKVFSGSREEVVMAAPGSECR